MKLRIAIIGDTSHGKSILAKTIEQLSNINCEVMNTQDLIEIKKKEQIKLEDLEKELVIENKKFKMLDKSKHKKKGKEIKSWQKNKFYQR